MCLLLTYDDVIRGGLLFSSPLLLLISCGQIVDSDSQEDVEKDKVTTDEQDQKVDGRDGTHTLNIK